MSGPAPTVTPLACSAPLQRELSTIGLRVPVVVVCAAAWVLVAVVLSLLLGAVLGRADRRQREDAASSRDFLWVGGADKITR